MKVQNPIVKGFYPDPSVCEANGKYYLACSSFQFFPGVPIFESEDLVNWKQVGHCLTKLSQVELHGVPSSGGVFAPTLRYHDGRFYMVTNNNTFNKNFYVWTEDLTGDWSEAIFVDQGGIDPSLLFDDGKVYFTSNGNDEQGNPAVFQCEINVETGEKLTESIQIWSGNGGRFLESPHLYHIGDWYYLMAAEGGTEYGHMITYARSKEPFGPFENYAGNPVVTNRNLGGNLSRIQGVGHGDLIQDRNGNYYIVCLGFRQLGIWQAYHQLGREVYLTSAYFDKDGWFTAGEEAHAHTGIVTDCMELPIEGEQKQDYSISFEKDSWNQVPGFESPRWIYLRDYHKENYECAAEQFRLKGTKVTLEEADTPTFVGVRQSEFDSELTVSVSGTAQEAGVTFYMDEQQHYDLFRSVSAEGIKAVLRFHVGDAIMVAGEYVFDPAADAEQQAVQLKAVTKEESYEFYVIDGTKEVFLGKAQAKYLSSEVAGGFTGVVMGLYAVDEQENWAEFRNFCWKQGR